MRFLHLSTGDGPGGAYTGAYRLHESLRAEGHESHMFVLRKASQDPDVLAPSRVTVFCARVVNRLRTELMNRFILKPSEYSRHFFSYRYVAGMGRLLGEGLRKPDLIIVYMVANFLSAKSLRKIQHHFNAPMAFYLMDAGMLTGGCHYPWDCTGYQRTCGDCPVLRRPGPKDLSALGWKERHQAFSAINYSIIVGSQWLKAMTAKSSLHAHRQVHEVLLGIDPELFRPRNREEAWNCLGQKPKAGSIVIYFGAQEVDNPRKGFSLLFPALLKLQSLLPADLVHRITLLPVGRGSIQLVARLGFDHVPIGLIRNKRAFANTYNAADVFICPSVEDAGPMMINEAMMAGTPVIAFRMGVAEDLIVDGETGYIAPEMDADSLAGAMRAFVMLTVEQRARMGRKCRERALERSSREVQVAGIVRAAQAARLNQEPPAQ